VNDLAAVAIEQFPEIADLKALLQELGARVSQMSGSGGAVFGIFDTQESANRASSDARRRLPSATVITTSTVYAG